MTQPWYAEHAITAEQACPIIEKQFPELKPASLKPLGEGFDNSVFLVNERFVFRFPRRQIAVELIETETRLLPIIAPALPIPVPYPKFRGVPEASYPWPFAGYPIITGKAPANLSDEERLLSAVPFAHFLKTLHHWPLEEVEQLKLPSDTIGRMDLQLRKPKLVENIDKVRQLGLLDDFMCQSLRSFSVRISDDLADNALALVHGDLHIRNILVDQTGKISGIIDWGDTHIGHPAVDLSIAYSFLPPKGRTIFFQHYGETSESVKTMARFKAIYTAVLLLLYGHDLSDADLVRESQTALKLAMMD
ncbi:MAG: phosphotransferase [Tuberibacillus sp.]